MNQITDRTLLLLLVGALTAYLAFQTPELGAAIVVAAAVVALLHSLLSRE
ncbi:hypothetical protein [Streptomyces sp. CNQ085]|nr:hypothetical protein [Streptomyces sp. CNQ085]MCI0383649.1 hypothetical protein [Streptomyces sp. CNQ085]